MTTPMPYCCDAAIAAALTIALAFSIALVCAIIVGPEAPSFAAGAVIFVIAGPVLLWRLWSGRAWVHPAQSRPS
jgi:hypothetical protein